MKKRTFLIVACTVLVIHGMAALALWAACPAGCTCSKPQNTYCDQNYSATWGSCSQGSDPCTARKVTVNHQGLFGSEPNGGNETNVGTNPAALSQKCLTVYDCYIQNGACIQSTTGTDTMTLPLKSVPCI